VKRIEPYRIVRKRALFKFELAYVRKLLLKTGGNVSEAARLGQMDRKHLWRIMRRTLDVPRRKVRQKRR
jgi:ActR/RegA family two-component response regulator